MATVLSRHNKQVLSSTTSIQRPQLSALAGACVNYCPAITLPHYNTASLIQQYVAVVDNIVIIITWRGRTHNDLYGATDIVC